MLVVAKINSQADLVQGLPTLVVLGSLKLAACILGFNYQANQ